MSKRLFAPQVHQREYDSTGKELQAATNLAFKRFKAKSYVEKWNPTLKTLGPLLYILQGFAVLLAGYFVASLVYASLGMGSLAQVLVTIRPGAMLPDHLAGLGILLASTLLFVKLEKTKAKTLFAYLYEIFTEKKQAINWLFVPVLILSSVSIFTTLSGGQSGSMDLTEKQKELNVISETNKHDRSTDASLLKLEKRLSDTRAEHKAVLNREGAYNNSPYTWKGNSTQYKFDELDRLSAEMASLNKQIESRGLVVDSLKNASSIFAQNFNTGESIRFQNEAAENKRFGLGFSLVLELGILILLYFKAKIESSINAENRAEFKIQDNDTSRQAYELTGYIDFESYDLPSNQPGPGGGVKNGSSKIPKNRLPIELGTYPKGNQTANRTIETVSKYSSLSPLKPPQGKDSSKELQALRDENMELRNDLEWLIALTGKDGTRDNNGQQKNGKIYVDGKGFLVTCARCGEKAYKKSVRAKYCSKTCTDAASEERTGKKLHPSIKGSKMKPIFEP